METKLVDHDSPHLGKTARGRHLSVARIRNPSVRRHSQRQARCESHSDVADFEACAGYQILQMRLVIEQGAFS